MCAHIMRRAACPVCVHTHKCAQGCLCPCARVWGGGGAPVVMCTPLCVCKPVQGWLCACALLRARVCLCTCVWSRRAARCWWGCVGWVAWDGSAPGGTCSGATAPRRCGAPRPGICWVWVEETPLLPPQLFKLGFLQGNCFWFLQHGQERRGVGSAAARWP